MELLYVDKFGTKFIGVAVFSDRPPIRITDDQYPRVCVLSILEKNTLVCVFKIKKIK